MSYRERCYGQFVSKHWKHIHVLSKEEYDFHSKLYSKTYLKYLPENKEASILDIACGAGHFLYFLKKQGYVNAKGMDISAEQLDMAKQMGINDVTQADLFTFLEDHKEQYDLIIANDIIEHLYKDEIIQLLDGIRKLLKDGGKLIMSTENAASLFGASRVFIDFTHEVGLTPISLSQVLRVCNLDPIRIIGINPVHNLSSLIRKILWIFVKQFLKFFIVIERGMGHGLKKQKTVLEPRMFAVAQKTQDR